VVQWNYIEAQLTPITHHNTTLILPNSRMCVCNKIIYSLKRMYNVIVKDSYVLFLLLMYCLYRAPRRTRHGDKPVVGYIISTRVLYLRIARPDK